MEAEGKRVGRNTTKLELSLNIYIICKRIESEADGMGTGWNGLRNRRSGKRAFGRK